MTTQHGTEGPEGPAPGLSTRCVHAGEELDAQSAVHTAFYNHPTFGLPSTAGLLDDAVKSGHGDRRYVQAMFLLGLVVLMMVAGGCTGGGKDQSGSATPKKSTQQAQQPTKKTTAETTVAGNGASSSEPETTGLAKTGTIAGRVTDEGSGKPLSNVYITVGWEDLQRAAVTGSNGRYTVKNVPAGKSAPVFGFHEGLYRYHNSAYDDHLDIVARPGKTLTYDFALKKIDPKGKPEVSKPSITPTNAAPGKSVTIELNARGGKGGLSEEVFAAIPKLERLVLLKPAGGDKFSAKFTIPSSAKPGEYPVTFFTASNACYVPKVFPQLTLSLKS